MKNAKRVTVKGKITRVRVLKNKAGELKGTRIRIQGHDEELFVNAGFADEFLVRGNVAEVVLEKRIAGVTGYINSDDETILHGIDPDSGKFYAISNVSQLPAGDERIAKFEADEEVFLIEGDSLKAGIVDFYSESTNAEELASRKAQLEMELTVKAKAEKAGQIEAKMDAVKLYVGLTADEQDAFVNVQF